MKTQLTAEESAKLIELGVSPERASDIWVKSCNGSYTCKKNTLLLDALAWRKENISNSDNYGFIFTLTDILDMLPREVKCEDLEIGFCGEDWCAGYGEIMFFTAPELIDALYSLLVWCLEKGYVKLD